MTYKSKREPRVKQAEALERLKGREAFALLMAMRTGKTKVTLDDFGRLEHDKKVQDLLVIAPAGVYKTWVKAIDEDFSDDLIARMKLHVWESGSYGSNRAKQELSKFLAHTGPRVLLMNIEALSAVEMAKDTVKKFLDKRKVYVAIDESTSIKNPTAKRTKFINRNVGLRAAYRRILSGLPTPKSPLDLYSQFEFLDQRILGASNFYTFRARYAILRKMKFGGRDVPIVVGYQNIDDLTKRIAPHSFRVRLEDCYDLPPKMYAIREVPLTDEQKRIYRELKNFATSQLAAEKHVTATAVITQIIRMHQVLCGHTRDEQGTFHSIPERRTETLIDLLEEHDGKAIIWCSYDHDVQKVAEALQKNFRIEAEPKKSVVARFWGGNRATREEEEARFLKDPDCRFIVATAAAGGRGRMWAGANLVVYYSNTPDLEHRAQSEERAQTVGKTDSVLYVDLMVPGSVDEKYVHALRQKINMAATINGDNYREWLV